MKGYEMKYIMTVVVELRDEEEIISVKERIAEVANVCVVEVRKENEK